jgi:hypothetical protein
MPLKGGWIILGHFFLSLKKFFNGWAAEKNNSFFFNF